jgi:hypothetical protein
MKRYTKTVEDEILDSVSEQQQEKMMKLLEELKMRIANDILTEFESTLHFQVNQYRVYKIDESKSKYINVDI